MEWLVIGAVIALALIRVTGRPRGDISHTKERDR